MGRKKGLTLLELLIVMIILGFLAAIGITQYGQSIEKARSAEAYSVLSQIVSAEKAYFVENDDYTANFADLHSFTAAPLSDNFTYSIPSIDDDAGYAQAARKAGAGKNSYGMCFGSGKKASCADADSCDPGCP